MKKYFIIVFLLITGYSYAQEVPGWIDTTKGTSAAKYQSVSNARPLPVNTLGPVLRIEDSLYFYNTAAGDSEWVYNFFGKHNFIEIAWTDTAGSTDSVLAYIGIPGVSDTSWSPLGATDLADWNIDSYMVSGQGSTKQWWLKTTRPYLIKLKLANSVITPTQKGKFKLEAK